MKSPCRSLQAAPKYIKADEIPAAELEHEAEIARARANEEGKPENVMEKIVEGRVEKLRMKLS